jgi:LCP family protein required for cell wall assembly
VSLADPEKTDTPELVSTEEILPTETSLAGLSPTIEPVCGDDTSMTILVTGIDSTGYLFGLADSIRVVRLDFQTQKATVLALPRDIWVDIPGAASGGVNAGKLNQAYFFGTEGMALYDGSGYGSGLLAHTLQHNYGLQIDHYLSVNMYAFQEIVNALGGITVYFPEPVYIKHFNQPKLFLKAGTHHLDGSQAEQVVRARIEIGDFGRIRNQTRLLKALALKIFTPTGIERLPEITNRLLGYVLTDLSPADISQMICLASKIENKDEIIFETLISDQEQEQAGQWVMDEFQGFKVFALMVDKNMLTERLADFQAGIFP